MDKYKSNIAPKSLEWACTQYAVGVAKNHWQPLSSLLLKSLPKKGRQEKK